MHRDRALGFHTRGDLLPGVHRRRSSWQRAERCSLRTEIAERIAAAHAVGEVRGLVRVWIFIDESCKGLEGQVGHGSSLFCWITKRSPRSSRIRARALKS